ncbi:hypothetical protein BZA05DRAFT_381073 [Tricharina praecox]|uniref:uncharacterized protein n=1 Tax=Tricharina praecox TaxID=43433 RepID=UPI00221F1016|nr:uncharacterized protein BZA05DRAFT_381073 [Tricharina praecox]KAI5858400.1 hypothetical protein BZA05DRAFT_381073 [Tricharina praecox]
MHLPRYTYSTITAFSNVAVRKLLLALISRFLACARSPNSPSKFPRNQQLPRPYTYTLHRITEHHNCQTLVARRRRHE